MPDGKSSSVMLSRPEAQSDWGVRSVASRRTRTAGTTSGGAASARSAVAWVSSTEVSVIEPYDVVASRRGYPAASAAAVVCTVELTLLPVAISDVAARLPSSGQE